MPRGGLDTGTVPPARSGDGEGGEGGGGGIEFGILAYCESEDEDGNSCAGANCDLDCYGGEKKCNCIDGNGVCECLGGDSSTCTITGCTGGPQGISSCTADCEDNNDDGDPTTGGGAYCGCNSNEDAECNCRSG